MRTTIRRSTICGLVFLAWMSGAALADDIDGRYERTTTVTNLEDDTSTEHVDFLEVERKSPTTLFFVYESWHTNGHTCRLWGTAAKLEDGSYEYQQPAAEAFGESPCRALLHVTDEHIVVEDAEHTCRVTQCGARGSIGKDAFRIDSRRPLQGPVQVPW